VTDVTDELILRWYWEKNLITSDEAGFAIIKMSSLVINCGVEEWFTIMFENELVG